MIHQWQQNECCCDLHSICSSDNFAENVQSHLLAIDHGGSLVVNIQYHSQTVFVMNHQS
jgi:hypothetical protein